MAYEEFLRTEPRNGRVYTATMREAFKKKLASFIGRHGKYSVLEKSDNRRTSKTSAPRGEHEQVDARPNDDEDPTIVTTVSQSASDTGATAAAGGGRARKPPGFYRV
jgi:hypothetical protein